MSENDHDGLLVQHVAVTFELPAWHDTATIAVQVVHDVLERLERDGLRPYRTTIDITDNPTT